MVFINTSENTRFKKHFTPYKCGLYSNTRENGLMFQIVVL